MVGALPFIGRADDLDALTRAWGEARGGEPRVMLLRGAPGIGKTSILHALLAAAGEATVLRGTCQEDSSIPYLSIGSALRPLWEADASPFERLTRDRPAAAPLTPSSLEVRLDLVLETTSTLLERACTEPVLLALDDIHWADAATVELLSHLLQSLGTATGLPALFVVLAMRPIGGDSPAARLVERAARDPIARTHEVAGLDMLAVHELVTEWTGKRPSRPFLRALHQSSGGNPLLVRSLLDRLEAFGGIAVRGEMLVQTSNAELLASPRDLDQLLRDRLANVSEGCRRALIVAALLGDGSRMSALEALSGLDTDHFERALDEARAAHLLDDDGDTYRFDHPQLRQVLYHAPRGKRRAELHLRIADYLERSADPEDPATLIAVARHLRRAGDDVDAHRLLGSSMRAATAAEGLGAWAEAADAYDTALAVSDGETGVFRSLVATRAARAHWWNQDNDRALALAEEAVALARAADDLDLWAMSLELRARALWSGPIVAQVRRPNLTPYKDFLAEAGERRDDLRARVHWLIATVSGTATDRDAASTHLDLATELATSSGVAMRGDLAMCRGVIALISADPIAAAAAFVDAASSLEAEGDSKRVGAALGRAALANWMAGRLEPAAALAAEASSRTAAVGKFAESGMAGGIAAGVANCLGDHRALQLAHDAARTTMWTRFGQATAFVFPALARAHADRGDFGEAHAAIDRLAEFGSPAAAFLRPVLHAMEGDHEAARRGVREMPQISGGDRLMALASAVHLRVAQLVPESFDLDASVNLLRFVVDAGVRFDTTWGFDLRELLAWGEARQEPTR